MDSCLCFVFFACLICAGWTAPTGGLGCLAVADYMIKSDANGGMQLPYNLTGLERVDDCQPVHRHRVKRTNITCNAVHPRDVIKDYYCISNSPKLKCYHRRDGGGGKFLALPNLVCSGRPYQLILEPFFMLVRDSQVHFFYLTRVSLVYLFFKQYLHL